MAAKKVKVLKAKGAVSLDETLRDIRGKFGEQSIMKLGDKPNVDIDAISTSSIGLDLAIGIGGLPRGRIVEVFGPESSGKTTLALHVVAEAQKEGGICAFVDAEHALDPQYAAKIGVKIDDLFISQPDGGEEALQIVESLVKGGQMSVIVVDSVAMLLPKAELEGNIGDAHMAGQARLMSQALRILTPMVAKSNILVIFINQLRANIGGWSPGGPPPDVTSGGKALRYAASVRLDIRRIASIKKAEEVVGSRVKVKVAKNKVGAPFKTTEFDILYNEGISKEGEILAMGESVGIVDRAGASYRYGEMALGRGYDAARSFLKENPKVAEELLKKILENIND